MRRIFLLSLFFLTACSPNAPLADVEKRIVRVYASPAAEGWLPFVYACAERSPELLVERSPDIHSANLVLRVGESPNLDGTPYQIAEAELVIATNSDNLLPDLDNKEIRAIYEGKISNWAQVGGDDAEIELWAYPADDDLQVAFNEGVLQGARLSSLAKQAQSPRAMREAISADRYSIGFSLRDNSYADKNLLFFALEAKMNLPILVLSLDMDFPGMQNLIACIQE